jgi:hypothetical protein
MIYCVVPRALAGELYDTLVDYYKDEPKVEVIVDRRAQGGNPGTHAPHTDRRRQRPNGSFGQIDPPSVRT